LWETAKQEAGEMRSKVLVARDVAMDAINYRSHQQLPPANAAEQIERAAPEELFIPAKEQQIEEE
jgi:hypothetical protein